MCFSNKSNKYHLKFWHFYFYFGFISPLSRCLLSSEHSDKHASFTRIHDQRKRGLLCSQPENCRISFALGVTGNDKIHCSNPLTTAENCWYCPSSHPLHVRESKIVLDSGVHELYSGFYRYWIPDVLSVDFESRIPIVSEIPDSRFLELYSGLVCRPRISDPTSTNFPDSEIRIPLHGAILETLTVLFYLSLQRY